MKRVALALLAVAVGVASVASPAHAAAASHPQVDLTATLTAGPGRGGKVQYEIAISARDLDAYITELFVDLGDGTFVSMLLACDPSDPVGSVVTQDIRWTYAPGTYRLRAGALSSPDCVSGPFEASRPATLELVVTPAP